jgi:hypothetical protein
LPAPGGIADVQFSGQKRWEGKAMLATVSQLTPPNLRLEAANGVTYSYRRFGNSSPSALSLVCLIHYR